MPSYSAEFIQQKALVRGSSMSWVDFLKSEAVARAVADKVWAHLSSQPQYARRERRHLVSVRRSARFAGTWQVRVFLPGIALPQRMPGGPESNKRRQDAAIAALKAGYTHNDLVTSWSC